MYIYTTTGLGLRKNKKMVGVYHFLVYMQTAPNYRIFYIHHHGCAQRPRGGVYTNCGIVGSLHIHKEMLYTSHFLFFLGPNPVVVYIFWGPYINELSSRATMEAHWSAVVLAAAMHCTVPSHGAMDVVRQCLQTAHPNFVRGPQPYKGPGINRKYIHGVFG